MTIAVAHSESPRGRAALQAAAEEALLRKEPLAVLHIVAGVDKVDKPDPGLTKRVSEQLTAFPELTWRVHAGPEGFDTAEAVLGLADQVDATLLVIGSRHRTPAGKFFLGSTVQRVLLDAAIPVLVVKSR